MRSARNIAEHVNSGGSAVQVVEEALQRIHADTSNAFREVFDQSALASAAEIDRRIIAGESAGPLAGVPVAVLLCLEEQHWHPLRASALLTPYTIRAVSFALRVVSYDPPSPEAPAVR